MARTRYSGRGADTVLSRLLMGDGRIVVGVPASAGGTPAATTLTVWDAVDGTDVTDQCVEVDGVTPLTELVIPAGEIQAPAFWGPDGWTADLWGKTVNGDWIRFEAGLVGPAGPDGRSITSVDLTSGTGAPGTTDTYTITYSDTTTSTFNVYNGANGTGTGDVVGPAGATADHLAVFDTATGKLIKDGGVTVADLQPADADLTAIAALTTTSYGRAFLELADAAAARTALALGTTATVNTGTASGDVPLLSTGGRLPIARIASGVPDGTKFVRDDGTLVTPSSSGGAALLARVVRNPASATTYTSGSSSPTDVDATNLAATFTVPASGKVRVCLGGYAVSTGGTFYWSLRSGTTDVAGTERCVAGGYAGYVAVQDIVVTGLTPGASVTYKWAFRRASGSSLILCGGTEFSSTSYNGPATMEVWSEA